MEEKKYLKWYNKMGYGSGDLAGNVVYAIEIRIEDSRVAPVISFVGVY